MIQAQDFEADLDILKASLAKSYVTSTNRAYHQLPSFYFNWQNPICN